MLALVSLFMPSGVAKAEEPSTTWDTLTRQVSELASGQHTFNIDADLALTSESKPLTVPNGVAITLAGTGPITGLNLPAIRVESGGTLTLAGAFFTKVQFDVAGDLNFTAGSIHDSDPAGPVIFVNGGNFTMGGTADFSKNTVRYGSTPTPEGVSEGKYAPAQRYIGYTVAKGTDGYTPVQSDADTVHYVTRDSRQPSSGYGDHTGLGAWDYVLSDENTVVLGQRAKMWYHPNEGHFDGKAVDTEEEQLYTLYSSTKLVNGHPAARPAQMTPYEGKDPVRDETRTITDSQGRTASINSYTFAGWYCKAFTPDEITKGDAKGKGFDFNHAFTDGEPKNFETDSKGHKNPCGAAQRPAMANMATSTPIAAIVKPNEMTAYAGYARAFGVTYKFVSGTPGKTLPSEVLEQTPQIDTNNSAGYLNGSEMSPSTSSFDEVQVEEGIWTFQNWNAASQTIASKDVEFVGTWVLDQRYKVTHEFKAASGTLPTEIAGRTPADYLGEDAQGIKDGTEVKPSDFDQADFTDAEGKVWSFLGWDKSSDKINAADVHFIGYWGVELAKEPTFTEWKDSEITCDKATVTQTRTKTSYSYKWNKQTSKWDETTTSVTETQERDKSAEEVKACETTPEPEPSTTPSQSQTPEPSPDASDAKKPGVRLPKTGASGAGVAGAAVLMVVGAALANRMRKGRK